MFLFGPVVEVKLSVHCVVLFDIFIIFIFIFIYHIPISHHRLWLFKDLLLHEACETSLNDETCDYVTFSLI